MGKCWDPLLSEEARSRTVCDVKVKNVTLTQSDVHITRLKGPVHRSKQVQGAAWSQSVGVSGEASLGMFAYLFFKAFKTVGTYYLFKILNYKKHFFISHMKLC